MEIQAPGAHRRLSALAVALCALLLVAACGRDPEGERTREREAEPEEVVLTPDAAVDAEELGAVEMEPGVYQATVAAAELTDTEGVRSDPVPTQGRPTHGS